MAHALRYLVNGSIMFQEHPLLERPRAIRAAGFDAVEFWWPFPTATPSDADVDAFVTAVSAADLQLIGLNFAAGDMPGGDRGLVSWPGREDEFRASVEIACSIAKRLGTSAFNALYGLRLDTSTPQEQDGVALGNLVHAAEAAERIGAVVLLEPVSGAPAYPLKTAADVVAVIERVEAATPVRTTAMLLDIYHLATNGDDVTAAITAHAARIAHVQIADTPGRHEPGTGGLDIEHHLDQLAAAGYNGWVGLEYLPATTTDAGLAWLPRTRRAGTVLAP